MLSLIPTLLLLSSTAVHAASIITANTIISDIGAVDSAVVGFRGHIEAYEGGYLNQTTLFTDLASIIAATAAIDTEANLILSDFTPADSSRIVDFYASTLGEDIPSTGKALLAKKDIIVSMGEGESVALAQLTFQKGNDELARALGSKLTSEREKFESAARAIHEALQEGVDAFSAV